MMPDEDYKLLYHSKFNAFFPSSGYFAPRFNNALGTLYSRIAYGVLGLKINFVHVNKKNYISA